MCTALVNEYNTSEHINVPGKRVSPSLWFSSWQLGFHFLEASIVVSLHSQEAFVQDLLAHFIKVAVYLQHWDWNKTERGCKKRVIYQSESGNVIITQARENFLEYILVKRQEGHLAVPLARCICLQETCWGTGHFDESALLFQVLMQRWAAL